MESYYSGVCTISELQEVKQPNGSTDHEWKSVHDDVPCQLSHNRTTTTAEDSTAANVQIVIQLFINPDIEIKAGSQIAVTQNGRTGVYERSGEPALYPTHQEIILELVGDRA